MYPALADHTLSRHRVSQRSSDHSPSQTPPSSSTLSKRRRRSLSSPSPIEIDDEDDEPLAARMTSKAPAVRSERPPLGPSRGKKINSKCRAAPSTNKFQASGEQRGRPNESNAKEARPNVPEKMNDSQLDLIATGVTVDLWSKVIELVFLPSSAHPQLWNTVCWSA